jgi:putative flippase GtrA
MYKLLKQFLGFVSVSGVGFIIDFTCYYLFTNILSMDVFISNYLSAIPAVTFVFFVSTRFIFEGNLGVGDKLIRYFIYFLYQLVLLYLVSKLSQGLYDSEAINSIDVLNDKSRKIIVKLLITPITMTINFICMKVIVGAFTKEGSQ